MGLNLRGRSSIVDLQDRLLNNSIASKKLFMFDTKKFALIWVTALLFQVSLSSFFVSAAKGQSDQVTFD